MDAWRNTSHCRHVYWSIQQTIEEWRKKLKKWSLQQPHQKWNKCSTTTKSKRWIIIIKAVKGGAVVIIDINDYIREDNQHLNITHFYGKNQMTQ